MSRGAGIAAAALLGLLAFVGPVRDVDAAYSYSKSITIDHTKVGNAGAPATLSSFPMLYKVTDPDLRTTANGGHVTSASGFDIIFKDSGGTTLDHEIEKYVPTTGELVAWVRVPTLNTQTSGSNTVITIYYGDSSVVTSQENATGVWDSNFVGIWHLKESSGTGSYLLNSKQNAYHGDPSGSSFLANAKIAGGQQGGVIDMDNGNTLLGGDTAFTLSFWGYPNYASDSAWQSDGERWFFTSDSIWGWRIARRSYDPAGTGWIQADVRLSSGTNYLNDAGNLLRAQWNHFVINYDGAALRLYINGGLASQSTGYTGQALNANTTWPVFELGDPGSPNYIDEFRYSRSARSAHWVKTEYNNQNAPGDIGSAGFYTVGSESGGILLGHWTFNEGSGQSAADSSGNGNNGMLGTSTGADTGDPTWECVGGGYALNFDGSNDEVKLPNQIIGDAAAWTIAAWIKMGADTADQRTIYSEGNTSAGGYLFLYVDDSNNHVRFYSDNGSNYAQVIGSTNVEDNQWHRVVMVQRSKTDRELYVDGVSQGTDTQNAGTLNHNTASIGYLRANWVADPFKGSIDDVRVYNYALSTGEIAALGASPPTDCGGTGTNYRSIGVAADLVNSGTISITSGSTTVTKSGGTGWQTANRGQGDRLTVDGNDYVISSVDSENQLTLTSTALTTYAGSTYTIARQFTTLQGWANCVQRNTGSGSFPCSRTPGSGPEYFASSSSSLVSDDRSEVGVAYNDGSFNAFDFTGVTTDATHDITLTVAAGNRHAGVAGTGAVLNNTTSTGAAITSDQALHLTLEWLEITGSASGAHGMEFSSTATLVIRNNIVHDVDDEGIRITNNGASADVYNNIVYNTTDRGINFNNTGLTGTMRFLNNTVYNTATEGIRVAGVSGGTSTVRNNIALACGSTCYSGTFSTSSNNISSDASGSAGLVNLSATASSTTCGDVDGCVGFQSLGTPPDLHLISTTYTNKAVDGGADLSAILTTDIDGQTRPVGAGWDIGADEGGGSAPGSATLSSAADQSFTVGQAAAVASTLTVTDSSTPTITTLNDIRIRIPAALNMVWDTSVTTITPGGAASGKVAGTGVYYEDSNKTAVINVTTNFAASDVLTIAGLKFTNFTAASAAGNLELMVAGSGGATAATDDKTITIAVASGSTDVSVSAGSDDAWEESNGTMYVTGNIIVMGSNRKGGYRFGGVSVPQSATITNATLTVYRNWGSATTTLDIYGQAADDPATFTNTANDISSRTRTSAHVLWPNLTTGGTAPFTSPDISSVIQEIVDRSGWVSGNHLAILVWGADSNQWESTSIEATWGQPAALHIEYTYTPAALALSSAANQTFTVGQAAATASTMTVTDASTPSITAAQDLRLRIPAALNMTWDTSVTSFTAGGAAAGKVNSSGVTYEDSNKTAVLNVTSNFAASDVLTIAGLKFTNFTAASSADNLELVVAGSGGATAATDDKTITISSSGGTCTTTVYSTAQNATTYVVPTGATTLTVKAWGAGGGGGGNGQSGGAGGTGGGGGFARGDITVTPGESLTIVLGGGGNGGGGSRPGGSGGGGSGVTSAGGGTGGAPGDNDAGSGGGGGGYSAVKRGATFLIQAGGGGGGGGAGKTGSSGAGGAGGGSSGVAGGNASGQGGGAGTSSAGGAVGSSSGSGGSGGTANTGGNGKANSGNAYGGGGGGGAGRYGGGGGGAASSESSGAGGGGGGSSLVTGTNTTQTAGSGTSAGNNGDSDYAGAAGQGGAANGGNGNPGRIVLIPSGACGGTATLSSAANQTFTVGQAASAASTLTVTDASTPTITTLNDIRIRIPAALNMTWDTTVTSITPGGGASGKVAATGVYYEDGNKTAVINVTTNFAASDVLTIAGLKFTNFTAASAASNLELVVAGSGGATAATDDKTVTIIAAACTVAFDTATVSPDMANLTSANWSHTTSGSNRYLVVGLSGWDFSSGLSGVTVTYAGVPMTNLGGIQSANTNTVVLYGLANPASGTNTVQVSNIPASYSELGGGSLSFTGVAQTSSTGTLASVPYGGSPASVDITLASGDMGVAILYTGVSSTNPTPGAGVTERTSLNTNGGVTYHETGTATGSGTVTMSWTPGNPTDKALAAIPIKACTSPGTLSSAANQTFTVGQAAAVASTMTVTDGSTATITAAQDLRIRIPAALNMTWDTSVTSFTAGGGAAGKVNSSGVTFEDSNRTAVINVTTNFAASDVLTIAGLKFTNFTAASSADNLELVVAGSGGATAATDDKTITISAPSTSTLSSAVNQTFTVGQAAAVASTMTVTDAATPTITAAQDLRIRIPAALNMIWDTSVTSVTLGGAASGKVNATGITYEDSNKTAVLNVSSNFAGGDQMTIAGLKFTNFTAASSATSLQLVVAGSGGATAATDDKTITITSAGVVTAEESISACTASGGGAISFVAAASAAATSGNLIISKPTGTAQDDVMIASFSIRSNSATITPPSGWSLVRRINQTSVGTYSSLAVYIKVAGASEPSSYTWTLASYTYVAAGIATFSGVDTASPIDVENGAATSTTTRNPATPSVTTTVANAMLVASYSIANNGSWANPPPSGMTQAFQVTNSGEMTQVNYALQASAGSTGTKTATDQGGDGTDSGAAHILALKPAAGSPTSLTLPSWTPQSGELLLLGVTWRDKVARTISGNGLTWTLIAERDNDRVAAIGSALYRASGTSPTAGPITISLPGNTLPVYAAAVRLSGVDTTVNQGIEASATASGPAGADDANMKVTVTTVTPNALALAWGGQRGSATLTLPSGETVIIQSSADCGSGGDRMRGHMWQETVATPGPTELGQDGSLSTAVPWTVIGVSIKPSSGAPTASTLASAANQTFSVGQASTTASTITVTDSSTPTITAAQDVRIRIPATLNMTWDTSVTSVTLGGTAAGKVSSGGVTYEDSGKTAVLNVTSNFTGSDQVTIDGLKFTNFTAVSSAASLQLVVAGSGGATAATDSKTKIIVTVTSLSSASNQSFTVGQAAATASALTVTDGTNATITAAQDIRIRIPAALNMTWDTSATSVTVGGGAAGKVSTSGVTYEDSNKTVRLNVTSNFSAGDQVTIGGLKFTNFTAASAADNLELVVSGSGGATAATDDKTITIITVSAISSAVNQTFAVGQAAATASTITVTDSSAATITASQDLRIRIPAALNMTWDPSVTTATLGGSAAGKVSSSGITYEESNKTVVLNVTSNFAGGDQVTIAGLKFANFTAVSSASSLELVVSGSGGPTAATDDKTITIVPAAVITTQESISACTGSAGAPITFVGATQAVAGAGSGTISFRAGASAGVGSGVTSLTVNKPSGLVQNDVMYASIAIRPNSATVTPPAGWGLVRRINSTSGTSNSLVIYGKVAGSSEPGSYTWTLDSGHTGAAGGILAFSGVDTSGLDGEGYATGFATYYPQAPSITTTVANTMLIASYSISNSNTWENPPPSGMTQGVQATGGGEMLQINYEVQATPGATGTKTAHDLGPDAADGGNTHILALKPAAGGSSDLTINKPAGTAQNEVMIASVAVRPDVTITPPSGWTLVRRTDSTSGTNHSLATYQKVAGASEPSSYTWTLSSNSGAVGGIASFSGVDTSNPIDVESGQATPDALTHATPSVTTTVANAMLVTSHTTPSSYTWTPPSGMSEAVDVSSNTPTVDYGQSVEVNYVVQAAAGATGTKTATANGSNSDPGAAHILALKPAAGPTTSLTLPSWTPQSGELLLVGVALRDETVVPTVSGNGLTWTQVADRDNDRGQMGVNLFRASGSFPTSGAITISLPGNTKPAYAVAVRLSNVDTSVNDGIEAVATASGPAGTDDANMKVTVTTVTAYAMALAWGGQQGSATLTLPSGETLIDQSSADCGSGGDRMRGHMWDETVPTPGPTELGQDNSLSTAAPWAIIGVSIKPYAGPPVTPATLSSAANQTFIVGQTSTAAITLTVTDSSVATISAAQNLRIRIPAALNMTWDSSVTTATLGGTASGKVSATGVTYEDSNKTVVLDVSSNFAGSDQLTISGLRFTNFTATSSANRLELVVAGASGATAATDDKTISIISVSMLSSASNQTFNVGQASTTASTITVTDSSTPTITSSQEIRIRIPAALDMTWDSSVTTITRGGSASGKVSSTVTYEDSNKTVRINVWSDFSGGDQLTISGLKFTNFGSASAGNLQLVVAGSGGATAAIDDKTITIKTAPAAVIPEESVSACVAPGGSGVVTIGTVASASDGGGNSTLSVSNVNLSGANAVVVLVGYNNDNYETVDSVVIDPGGANQTSMGAALATANESDDARIYVFGLVNPPQGTFTVRVYFNTALASGRASNVVVYPLSGVDTSAAFGTAASNNNTSSSSSVTVPSASGELVLAGVAGETIGSSTVALPAVEDTDLSGGGGNHRLATAHQDGASTSVNFNWSHSDDHWATAGVSVKPGTTSMTSLTLPSWTPQSDELLLVGVALRDESVVPTVSGNGLTWTQVADKDNDRGQMGVTLFRASGSSPTSGAITISLPGNADPVYAVAVRLSGVDTSVNQGIEAIATASSPGPDSSADNNDMRVTVTTLTANAMALAWGGHRGSATLTPDSGETIIKQSSADCGTSGDRMRGHMWEETVATPGSTTLGTWNDLDNTHPWAAIGVSIKPLGSGTGDGPQAPGRFNAFEPTTVTGAATGVIRTKIAGNSVSLDIAALDSSRVAIDSSFTGTVRVEVLDASNNSGALDGDGCRSSWTVIQTLSNPTFYGGNNGRKTISFTEANSYPNVRIRVSYPTSSPSLIGCSNDNFAIRPSALANFALSDVDWETAGATRALTSASFGAITHKAGRPLSARASAVNANGTSVTTNYSGTPTKWVSACAGSACTPSFGTLTLTTTFAAGQLSTDIASYNEVGSFALQLVDSNFANVDANDTVGDCSAYGRYVCSATMDFGRFVPNHFTIAYNSPAFAAGCGAFTYLGQKFNYSTAPEITVTAKGYSNNTTSLYQNSWWRITNSSLTGKAYTTASGTLDISGAPGTDPSISATGNGTGKLTFSSGSGFQYSRGTPVAPFDAEISLEINVVDADGISYASNPARFGQASAGAGMTFNSGKPMRFGRFAMGNANGSQLLPLTVRVEAQYWSGTAFVTNTLDSCSTITSTDYAMSNYTGNLSGSPTCETAISGGGTLSAGRGTLIFAAPGTGNDGSVTLTANLGASASGSTCTTQGASPISATTANLPHLLGNWNGGNYDTNPSARAS
ncbi:MAG: hypothetical protein AMJ69_08220, partial [Gammaproteobacteria bacterium SG8_47]